MVPKGKRSRKRELVELGEQNKGNVQWTLMNHNQRVCREPRTTRELKGKNRDLYEQLPLLIRSPNKQFLGDAKDAKLPRMVKVDEVKPK